MSKSTHLLRVMEGGSLAAPATSVRGHERPGERDEALESANQRQSWTRRLPSDA